MVDEPYKTLGISRTATAKQIRTAFLKLAKTTQPDLNPGDPKAEERFKAINAANDLLSDPDRRAHRCRSKEKPQCPTIRSKVLDPCCYSRDATNS